MKLARIQIAIVAMLTSCAYGGLIKRAGNATEPTLDPQVLGSLSTWFGWQLQGAGAFKEPEFMDGCQDLKFGDKWASIGLVPDKIGEPLCNLSDPDPNAFPNSIPAITAIVRDQIIGSFNTTKAFDYICDNLAPFQIDQFYLTDATLLEAVCNKAGKQVPPRPFGRGAGRRLSEAAGYAARNTASILYATMLAAGAEDDTMLNIMCAHAPNHVANLNAEQLNGTLVEERLCSFKQPLSIAEAQNKILSWTSRLFVTVLENVGDVGGWLGWLCGNLDVEGMNSVGLAGWGSQQQICSDAESGLSKLLELPQGISCK